MPAKVNQQGATRAGIVFGLHAERTMNETMSYKDFNKNSVYNDKWQFDEFIASRGSADTGKLMRARYTVHRQHCRQQQEDAGWAQEEPHGGLGEGDLASQLPLQQPCGLFCVGRL
jgi:hypothetical protein